MLSQWLYERDGLWGLNAIALWVFQYEFENGWVVLNHTMTVFGVVDSQVGVTLNGLYMRLAFWRVNLKAMVSAGDGIWGKVDL